MPPMGDKPTVGDLFRAKREPLGWKRTVELTRFEERTMRYWESGRMPPLDKALIMARRLGISLDDLVEAALGEPWATELSAGTDQLDREAADLDREVDALTGPALDGGDPPSDEDEPQSDQAG